MGNPSGRPDALLTIGEAARIAGRSYSWAHDRASDGRFDRLNADDGRTLVTASSVSAEITRGSSRPSRNAAIGRHLRLIVNN